MLFQGILLGIILFISIMLSFRHLPYPVKYFFRKHRVLGDLTASAISYIGLSAVSHSLIAVVGAIVTGLLVNFAQIFNEKSLTNKEKK